MAAPGLFWLTAASADRKQCPDAHSDFHAYPFSVHPPPQAAAFPGPHMTTADKAHGVVNTHHLPDSSDIRVGQRRLEI
jgi:hypothetical protein